MLNPPHRPSLIKETADVIRRSIKEGTWLEGTLPSERFLVDQLRVSRSTVRSALSVLEKEGHLKKAHNGRRVIAGQSPDGTAPLQLEVSVLLPQPPSKLGTRLQYSLFELQDFLLASGYTLNLVHNQKLSGPKPEAFLTEITRNSRSAAWLLVSATPQVQTWFGKTDLPCLLVGFCHDQVRLPSFDLDLGAVIRHAVGLLTGKGHRRIALIRTSTQTAGMRHSEQAFTTATSQSKHEIQDIIEQVHPSPRHICLSLDRLLKLSEPPTALIVCEPHPLLTVVSHLQSRGLKIGRDISVVSRDHDDCFEFFQPSIARYQYKMREYSRRLIRLTDRLLSEGTLPKKAYRAIPRYVPGETVGNPPPGP